MGYLLINAGQVMDTDKVFASLVVIAVVGAVVIKLQRYIDRKAAALGLRRRTAATLTAKDQDIMRKTLIATALAVAALAAPPAQANDMLHIGEGPFIPAARFFIARDKGYFAKLGLDVDTRIFNDGALAVPAMVSGELDITIVTMSAGLSTASPKPMADGYAYWLDSCCVSGDIENIQPTSSRS